MLSMTYLKREGIYFDIKKKYQNNASFAKANETLPSIFQIPITVVAKKTRFMFCFYLKIYFQHILTKNT